LNVSVIIIINMTIEYHYIYNLLKRVADTCHTSSVNALCNVVITIKLLKVAYWIIENPNKETNRRHLEYFKCK